MSMDESTPAPSADNPDDVRLYVTDPEDWTAHVKTDWEKVYCYQKHPGEDFYHLILGGEIYLVSAGEKLCLRCALQRGVITRDRLYWQHRVRKKSP